MKGELERLFRWVVGNLDNVVWLVILFGGFLLPIFKRIAQAKEAQKRKAAASTQAPPPLGPREAPEGPARFDWEKWFEETIRREPEPEEAEPPEPTPAAPAASVEAPVRRRPPLTEQRPYDELVEPLTRRARPAEVPLSEVPLEGAVRPLTEMPAYDTGGVPEGVGALEPGRPMTLGEGYRPALEAVAPEVLEGEPVTSLGVEAPVAPQRLARFIPGDWTRAVVLGEILGPPAALRSIGMPVLAPPGL